MPKLKAALFNQQYNAARYQAEKKARENADAAGYGSKQKKRRPEPSKLSVSAPTTPVTPAGTKGNKADKEGDIPHPKRKPTIPIDGKDTILLLGEANFSYARSLIREPHCIPGRNITATSFDSEEVCLEKYPDAAGILEEIRAKGVTVRFGVDGGDLEATFGKVSRGKTGKGAVEGEGGGVDWETGEGGKKKRKGEGKRGYWSRVIFNFPHVGAGITDQDRNILANQTMLLRTLCSVHPFLSTGKKRIPGDNRTNPHKTQKRKRPSSDDEEEVEVNDGVSDLEDEDPDPELAAALASSSSGPAPTPDRQGTILISLLDQAPYTLWQLPKLATKPPPTTPTETYLPSTHSKSKSKSTHKQGKSALVAQPRYTLLRSFEFDAGVWDGYAHRRTIGFKDGLSKAENEEILGRKGKARTWEFAPRDRA